MSKNITIETPNAETITISNLTSHGVAGFSFDATSDVPNAFGRIETNHYRTNEAGQGLWKNDQQVFGTGQFEAANRAQMRRAIHKFFNN